MTHFHKAAWAFSARCSQVLAYGDRQAVIWFALLVLRNADKLAPVYGFAAAFSASSGLVTYWAICELVKAAS